MRFARGALIVGPRRREAPALTWLLSISAVVIGFVVLVWAADRFVLGAAAAARNFGVSALVIGLTIVGFGTSAPEFLVSGIAALTGSADLCVGNALGSNIANVALVLGAAAIVAPMDVQGTVLRRELPILVGCMLLATGLMLDRDLGRIDGAILMGALLAMMGWVVWLGLKTEDPEEMKEELPDPMPTWKAVFWVVAGLALLLGSSRTLVWGATELARAFGVSELVIGLSVVAFGTSLPELAASVMAARRGEHELAVGNVIGSNMFNTLGVLALPGLIAPSEIPLYVLRRDIPVMFGVTLLFFVMTKFFLRPSHVSRVEGGVLVAAFLVYMGAVFYTVA
ncbi:MAG TPA: calcium/sodium antiporter [Sandaracinaceae bacterium LLY-WYZ-13_1]|nr:calcium/sodium antiporter [Sandaracinaceae bacterium LLY-WYZ-13_1]